MLVVTSVNRGGAGDEVVMRQTRESCRHALLIVIVALVFWLTGSGCGGVSIQFRSANARLVSGFVSIIQVTSIVDGNGSVVSVTIITLLQTGSAQDFTFCGSQSSLFPVNRFVQARFLPGPSCGTLLSVAVTN
jgi:hypothetical protein